MAPSRREFLAAAAALPARAAAPRFRIGITTNTRGGWERDVWLSFREARQAGFRHMESFVQYFVPGLDDPGEARKRAGALGVDFETVSNGGPLEMHFEDPARREKLLADHLRLARFVRALGCDHLKINTGPRRPEGATAEDLRQMSQTLNELGRRVRGEGLRFGVHAHMWSQLENRREIDYVLEHTDPALVGFVLDTGHITMAGMDPVALARALGSRVIEFHLKDTPAETRGGARRRIERNDPMQDPVFFALGTSGGVDFPALKAELDRSGWRGWLTVELDSSPQRPPVESARISREYLEKRLKIAANERE